MSKSFKDYYSISVSDFERQNKKTGNQRDVKVLSLAEQLAQFGSTAEKAAVRKFNLAK